MPHFSNAEIASCLMEISTALKAQGANPYRTRAYERASESVKNSQTEMVEILERDGVKGLEALPNIGRGIAGAIREVVSLGRCSLHDRLHGGTEAEVLFQMVPSIGPKLAHRIHEELQIDSLEELELAANDGRLKAMKGFGNRRLAAIIPALTSILGSRQAPLANTREKEVSVKSLLDLDTLYRKKAAENRLPVIAPRRFNPTGKRWLPIMHTTRAGKHYTVMFSNSALAHRLGRNLDWVIIYYTEDDMHGGQFTIVTETYGVLRGKRVVRGRERECSEIYRPDDKAPGDRTQTLAHDM